MGYRRSPARDSAIRAAVESSRSIAGVLRTLGLRTVGGNYNTIHRAVAELQLDTSHWTGQGHRKGSNFPVFAPRPLRKILINGSYFRSSALRERLMKEGLLPKWCSCCGSSRWLGYPMPLELDHIDGVRTNNTLENLRLLCPNCHALTPTYRGRNKRNKSRNIAP